jgi:hypothetical protein
MDAYRIRDSITQASVGITRGSYLRVEDGRGMEVSLVYGSLWITQQQDPNDNCLDAGESFRVDRDGVTFVYAVQPSLCTLTPPASNARDPRVSMVAAGAEPVELFDTGARRKRGRFDAWLERFWVPLFTATARPTTAAL